MPSTNRPIHEHSGSLQMKPEEDLDTGQTSVRTLPRRARDDAVLAYGLASVH